MSPREKGGVGLVVEKLKKKKSSKKTCLLLPSYTNGSTFGFKVEFKINAQRLSHILSLVIQ